MYRDSYDVIIIGAGLAGLSSARTLISNGIDDVLILEAQDRIGGRVWTQSYGSFDFDYGAQWIHGQLRNKLYDFAVQHDLISSQPSTEGEGLYLTQKGHQIDPSMVEMMSNRVERVLSELNVKAGNDKRSIDQVLAQVKEEGQWNTELDGLLKWHYNYQLIDNSCYRLDELPVDAWKEYDECNGNYCQTVKNGFSCIIDRMVSDLPRGLIRCGQVVQKVEWNGDVNNSSNNNSLPRVIVTLSTGAKIACNHVIVTCSVGYLKAHQHNLFHPSLPDEWRSALDRCIGFGPVTKILLVFDTPFWEEECKGFQFAWTETDPEDAWPHYMTGFDVIHSTGPLAFLLGWVGGDGSEFLSRSEITDDELGRQCVQLLKRFTGKQNIPDPARTIRTRWEQDPYVLGAYSYRKAVFDPVLLEPIGPFVDCHQKTKVPSLIFAGEALHLKFYSTAHGAFESGQDQALKIIQWKKDNHYF